MTRRQHELLLFIEQYIAKNGIAPSFEEMRVATGRSSKSHIFALVRALEEQGRIVRLPNRARTIEVVANAELPRHLNGFSLSALATEARRRGYVMGYIHRDDNGKRTFKEFDPKLDIHA